MDYGYARVSTTDQDLTIQHDVLVAAGCAIVRGEKLSGTSTKERVELRILLDFMRPGDVLVCTRIDRLARSMRDLQNILAELKEKGASLRCTEQPVDTSNAAGKAFLDMLGVFAEFETNLRRERQLEGIAAAKVKGVYRGRPANLPRREQVIRLKSEGMRPAAIAKAVGMTPQHVHRIIKAELMPAAPEMVEAA